MAAAIFFNLLANASLSIVCGLLVVSFFIWLFKVPVGSSRLFLLSLPFVKVVYDCLRGVPADSVLYTYLDLLNLPPNHQQLELGFGFSKFGPTMNLAFSAKDPAGKVFSSSLGDYLTAWVSHYFGSSAPFYILCVVVAVSVGLLLRRVVCFSAFELRRKRDRVDSGLLKQVFVGWRVVDVYISDKHSGSPFTGGLFRPYICVPRDSYQMLKEHELEAVLLHELGHIEKWDLLGTMLILSLGDLFWFVPGYKWLSHKLDSLREILADQHAVDRGAKPESLASALVSLKQLPSSQGRYALYSGFFRQ